MHRIIVLLMFLIHASVAWTVTVAAPVDPGPTVVLDASDFLNEIPKGHTITDAARLDVAWIFNNMALVMGTRTNYIARAQIREAGTYYLFARSMGEEGSQFRVAVGGRVIDHELGDEPLRFERAGPFELEAGTVDVRLMRIEPSPVLDALVLTKDSTFDEADLRAREFGGRARLLKDYAIPRASAIKFGDVNGDGQTDFMVLTPSYSARVFDFDGTQLWSYEAPEEDARDRASFEAPGAVWDFDRDGAAEVVHWRLIDGQEYLVVADGRTGEVIEQTPWPTPPPPHPYNNFRIAIGRLEAGYPDDILIFTDTGGTISVTAYNADLDQRWQHTEHLKKDHLGHYVYPIDLDGDSIDEVAVGSLVLDADGHKLWDDLDLFYDNHDHVDSYRFADLDDDGRLDAVTAHSENGVIAYDALTGAMKWQSVAEHTQQIEVGDFLAGWPTPQVAVTARTYGNRQAGEPYLSGQVWWFTRDGALISKWPGKPLNGNPVFAKGDWAGDGREALFWYKFRLTPDGRGELYFGEPVYHMFDFMGDRADEVITHGNGRLKIYGYPGADPDGPRTQSTPEEQRRVTNHSHYS